MTAIRVLVFGSLRDRLGAEEIRVLEPATTVAEVWAAVAGADPSLRARCGSIRCARNLEYCDWDSPVKPGDEVAFMPPVCGGASDPSDQDQPGVTVALTADPIAVDALLAAAGGAGDGAVACFLGRVRDHSEGVAVHALDYDAYAPMALAVMRHIAEEVRGRHRLSTVAVVHRVGELAVGDVAVAVVTASAHRAAALDACRELIEAVKADVPIWKGEHTAVGTHWVDARHAEAAHG